MPVSLYKYTQTHIYTSTTESDEFYLFARNIKSHKIFLSVQVTWQRSKIVAQQ